MRLKGRTVRLLLLIAVGYLALCTLVFFVQDAILFPARGVGRGAALADVPGVQVEWIVRADGGRSRAAVTEAPTPTAVMVWFCGNGEDLRSGVMWARVWREYGLSAVVAEYPGYGDSEGEPSEASVRATADAAVARAAAMATSAGVPLIAGGASLGSFGAVHVAASGRAARLLLLAPFTSVRDVAAARFWFLPVGLLLRHPFDNLARAREVTVPTLVLHGDQDAVIAAGFGERLATALRARYVVAGGCGHNDLPVGRSGRFGDLLHGFFAGR